MDDLTTQRLRLQPIRFDDAANIERHIFEDPEIVKGLAHDGANPDVRRRHAKNWSSFGPDGNRDFWRACRTGLYAITDRSGSLAPADKFIGVTGIFLKPEAGRWDGELFYALARPFHGKGIMSEAAAAVVGRFKSLPDAGSLYALYWQMLNPVSGKILDNLGFIRDGEKSVIEEYDVQTAIGIRRFELWRLARAKPAELSRITREVGIKLGNLEYDGISNSHDNRRDMLAAFADLAVTNTLLDTVDSALEQGRQAPGLALMRLRVQNGRPLQANPD